MKRLLPLFIALRYLWGLGRGQATALLAVISIAALTVGTAALIVLFSVFNGFDNLISDLYKAFYPDIRITAAKGKFFSQSDSLVRLVRATPGVAQQSNVLEDNVWATNGAQQQVVATVKGVENAWFRVNNLEPYLLDESAFDFTTPDGNEMIMGATLASRLGTPPGNAFSRVVLHYPNTSARLTISNAENAFQTELYTPTGIFAVQQDFDERYMLCPLRSVQRLIGQGAVLSAIELRLAEGARGDAVKRSLQQQLGSAYKVETRYEQNRTLYAVMTGEKWAIYAILLFVLLLASVNMVGALSLLALEKQRDAAIVKAMGGTRSTIRNTILAEGALWGLLGGLMGLTLGLLLCWGQQKFGLVKLHGFIVEQYPVAVAWSDCVLVVATAVVVGLIASVYPAVRLSRRVLQGGWAVR